MHYFSYTKSTSPDGRCQLYNYLITELVTVAVFSRTDITYYICVYLTVDVFIQRPILLDTLYQRLTVDANIIIHKGVGQTEGEFRVL